MIETTAFAITPDGGPGRKITIRDSRDGHLEAWSPDTDTMLAAAQILRDGKYVTGWAVSSTIDRKPVIVDDKTAALFMLRRLAGRHRAA